MEYYRLALYIIFGILPSLIWLLYYLAKDMHPEPKKMILKVFFWGAVATIPTLFFQIIFTEALNQFQYLSVFYSPEISGYLPAINNLTKWFVIIAFTEELFKYLVVRWIVFQSGELDEPLDIMLYMVVAALGFATLENTLYLFSPIDGLSFDMVLKTTVIISFLRFIGATFLHTLCSGLVGYFMALSSLRLKHRFRLTILGLFLAVLLHGLYNFSIINLRFPFNVAIPGLVIFGLAAFMIYDFDGIKKFKSIVKLKS
ncbi:MAG: hypothetical protein A3C50_02500 [Candidatus Staskawiczbacteria bacterium RIFCSPHIGHO2_02_FULL_43_16]|uniref:Protease PrsW n=1 Tax=Candidatus Staskawiczbacteria bacterium RIFCSPHIGHO2_01_FULL_41_41 TaxID=1802203 RepID=A0A1G2HV44_9BACT|nr:MAG: hypothetical protein A2822_01585 [Candidatus Staskawiczbacteria bacterium RIFCSPHIGHO2_01_FULL_41_41]OGZ68157.1 MAG: hypothetical protein A3C50_02500 [Candidatus Staskawiczbacteria bacterium RIFCSPHIGHO2_02_FULL_43_16]OGZ74947.1 MAG: hypothetical protein A3A12_03895 [Candidatus Staskawiczbacteria bacterium RIFCSPLOWO2_01_FULL_43_17b]